MMNESMEQWLNTLLKKFDEQHREQGDHKEPQRWEDCEREREQKRWVCPTCGVVEPRALCFGQRVRYVRSSCACQQAARAAEKAREREEMARRVRLREQQAIFDWLLPDGSERTLCEKTFATFEASVQPLAYQAALDYTDRLCGTLVLYGSYGTGKTHLLAAICNEAYRRRGLKSRFTTAPRLFSVLSQMLDSGESSRPIIQTCITAPLLVIDDVDKARWSEYREEVYFEIIDSRVRRGLPIAISTNRLDALADYVGGAVCSRLKVGQIAVQMRDGDYRCRL